MRYGRCAQATHAKIVPKKVHAQGLGTEQLVLKNNQLIYKGRPRQCARWIQ